MNSYHFNMFPSHDNQHLLALEALINTSEYIDDTTGYPNYLKMVQCGKLLLQHVKTNKLQVVYCGNFIHNAEIGCIAGGMPESIKLWKMILDYFHDKLPQNAYIGKISNTIAIHCWGDDCVKDIEALLSRVSQFLANIKRTQLPIVTHSGYVVYPDDTGEVKDTAQLTKALAIAALQPKANPLQSRIQRYVPKMMEMADNKRKLEQLLIEQLYQENFSFFYLPYYDIKSHTLCGAEALVRFDHPNLTADKTQEYIQIIEESPYITDFTTIGLLKLAHFFEQNKHHFTEDFKLSFNLSAAVFNWSNYDIYAVIQECTHISHTFTKHLIIEITESAYYSKDIAKHMIKVLQKLKLLDIDIAIDDFGSGYGSMRLLLSDIPTLIKFDRELTTLFYRDDNPSSYLKLLLQTANKTDHRIIFEGIETELQKSFLLSQNVMYGQGFLFSQILSQEALLSLCKKS